MTLLVSCNKAPAPPTTPSQPAAPAAPSAPAPAFFAAGAIYDCHSPQKSRDIFVRFEANGTLDLGDTATDLQASKDVVLFGKDGKASWSTKNGSWTETNSFDQNTGEWTWSNDPGEGGMVDEAHYACKAI